MKSDFVVTVSVADLVAALTKNRAAHVERCEAATAAYWKALAAMLGTALARAQAHQDPEIKHLSEPESHAGDYDRVLGMLAMARQETLELTEQQYSQYVLDEWDWRGRFEAISSSYGC